MKEELKTVHNEATKTANLITENISRVIIGKQDSIELATIALMSGGHILVEDVPGVGKTILARSLAISSGCTFKRIQFTPDLLPTDVSGVSIYNQKNGDFEFREGPIVSQVVLADEINRATPKTQSAMLEAMEEKQVTMEGITRDLPRPFMVIATQNPIEYEGTFPLPEAQLDRFLLKVNLGYPDEVEEISILNNQSQSHPIDDISAVVTPQMVTDMQDTVKSVYSDNLIKEYIEETERQKGLREKTIVEFKNTLEMMVEIMGDFPIQELSQKHGRLLSSTLEKLPPRRKTDAGTGRSR